MRSSIRAIAILTAVACLGGLAGCKKKEEKPAETTGSAGTAPSGDQTADQSKRPGLSRSRGEGMSARLGLEPVTVAEVQPLIPALTGARQLAEPAQTAGGRRVTVMQCMDGPDVDRIRAELESKLTEIGFTSLRSSPRGKRDLVTVSGQKDRFRISATLRTGPYPDCPADQKKIKVLMSYFKRNPRPPTAPGTTAPAQGTAPAPAPGTAGATAQ
jgi:hypothetical protein